MSYQCEVLSCDAMNRVIAGSPLRPNQRWKRSIQRPAIFATHTRTAFVTGATPANPSTLLMNSQSSTGSPLLMKYALPVGGAPGASLSAAHRWASAALSMYVTSTVSGRTPMRRSLPALARVRMRGIRCGSPGPQTRCGRSATVANSGPFAASTSFSAMVFDSGYGESNRVAYDSDSFAPQMSPPVWTTLGVLV